MRYTLGVQLLFDALLTQNEDLIFTLRKFEDAGDVDGSAVCRAEDVLGIGRDIEACELLEVFLP